MKGDVSWHLVYDSTLGPKISNIENISLPETYLTNIEVDCTRNIDDIVKSFNPSFRFDHKLPYPINVVRNVARLASKTRYLLASDIELYPSTNIVSMFMKLHERERLGLQPLVNKEVPHTYVLPIFEVKSGIEPPFNKSQLVKLVKSGKMLPHVYLNLLTFFVQEMQYFSTSGFVMLAKISPIEINGLKWMPKITL